MRWTNGEYAVFDDRARLDMECILDWLGQSYWAGKTPRDAVRTSWERAGVTLGVYHAEVVSKVGGVVAGLTYGASRSASMRHFDEALALNPDSAIAHVEYANAIAMLDGRKGLERATALCRKAAALRPHDAMERLDIDLARQELDD